MIPTRVPCNSKKNENIFISHWEGIIVGQCFLELHGALSGLSSTASFNEAKISPILHWNQ